MSEIRENSLSFPTTEYIGRYDGSRWRQFNLGDGGKLILTSRGQEMLAYNPKLRQILLSYKNEARSNREGDIRRWFRSGGNSDVFTVSKEEFVVKETSTAHSAWSALDRMDYLHGICMKFLPAYIRVPDHYGILFAHDLRRQYILMQKVNDGITVADLLNGDILLGVSPGLKRLAIAEFQGLKEKIEQAIERAPGRENMPNNLLPDWEPNNIIVDFTSPNKWMPFTFWIIDQ